MDPVLWVIAILSNWTVVHRILYTRARMRGRSSYVLAHEQESDREEKAGLQTTGGLPPHPPQQPEPQSAEIL